MPTWRYGADVARTAQQQLEQTLCCRVWWRGLVMVLCARLDRALRDESATMSPARFGHRMGQKPPKTLVCRVGWQASPAPTCYRPANWRPNEAW